MKIALNFDNFEYANDETTQTAHYGGSISVSLAGVGAVVPATGTDREWNLVLDVVKAISTIVGHELTDEETDRLAEIIEIQENGDYEF